MKQGLILFAHGSRDPEWARPFERMVEILSRNENLLVRVAYLELMQPRLADVLAEFTEKRVSNIRIVPVFLGAGGHVKQDLPRLVMEANPPVKVTIDPPIGEQDAVVEAIAAAIARGAPASS